MTSRTTFRLSLPLLVALAVPQELGAQEAPKPANTPVLTPSTMHVTVPGEVGKPAQQGWVKPGGEIKTDEYGNPIQNLGPPNLTPVPGAQPAPPAKPKKAAPSTGAAAPAPSVSIPVGPAPSGPAVATGANIVNIRGVLKTFEPGKSLTMTVRGAGKDVTYTLAPNAQVPEGLKAGDPVRIRVQAAEKGKVVDRVQIVTPK